MHQCWFLRLSVGRSQLAVFYFMRSLFSERGASRPFIKICGICNLEDAAVCANANVDAVGILLETAHSRDKPNSERMSVAKAKQLVASISPTLKAVLLIHETDAELISDVCAEIKPHVLQIQKSIHPNNLLKLKERQQSIRLIYTFHVTTEMTLEKILLDVQEYTKCGAIDAVLLDSSRGGSGHTHNWELSAEVVKQITGLPVILAGGLTAENVQVALQQVKPWGVDVMSSVNTSVRNKKDHQKIFDFVSAASGNGEVEYELR